MIICPEDSFFCAVHEFLLTDYFYDLTYAVYFMSGLAGIFLWFMIQYYAENVISVNDW